MGLDNGISFRNELDIPFDLPDFVRLDDDGDICYWRKCWGIRDEILDIIKECDTDEYEYEIKLEHIVPIIDVLKQYTKRSYWNENARSVFEYKDYVEINKQYINNLYWLLYYKTKHPEVEIFFYDSY